MTEKMFELDGHRVRLYGTESPEILFLQPVDERDALLLEPQLEAMERCPVPFVLAAFEVNDWNRD